MRSLLAIAASAATFHVAAVEAGTISIIPSTGTTPPAFSGSVNVTEKPFLSDFIYDVDNLTNADIVGFGVSNNGTWPYIFGGVGSTGYYGCTSFPGVPIDSCFIAIKLEATNWSSSLMNGNIPVPPGTDLSFADVFGDFLTASGGNDTINWFWAVEGAIPAGASLHDFFGFVGSAPESKIIGALRNGDDVAFFSAGNADVQPPTVPLPGAGWLMVTGLAGLGALRRLA
jgi:hypothetical protein